MSEIVLTGMDGSNPLGFLAALGMLRIAALHEAQARLVWRLSGTWRPVLLGVAGGTDTLVTWAERDRAAFAGHAALALEYDGKRDLRPPPLVFRRYVSELLGGATAANRTGVDYASAFGTDIAVDNNGNMKPTALHFTAGQQQFLRMVGELREHVTAKDFEEALVGPWTYARTLPVLGWDATASRDYALRAANPSKDEKAGVPGADWLAFRGLPDIGVVPNGTRVETTCCAGGWKTGSFTWPLWTVPLGPAMVRTVLRLDAAKMSAPQRSARGIGAVFSCAIKRSDQGGYGGFAPARWLDGS